MNNLDEIIERKGFHDFY